MIRSPALNRSATSAVGMRVPAITGRPNAIPMMLRMSTSSIPASIALGLRMYAWKRKRPAHHSARPVAASRYTSMVKPTSSSMSWRKVFQTEQYFSRDSWMARSTCSGSI